MHNHGLNDDVSPTDRPWVKATHQSWLEIMLNDPTTPYFLAFVVWILAWWLQMGPLHALFNFAPGVELPFFPAGVRTLSVFIFGFPGAVGVFFGSLVTYALYHPGLLNASPVGIVGCAAASAFSSYLAMRWICDLLKIPYSLSGLTMKNVGWIVITQSILSATLHQFFYHAEAISSLYPQESTGTTLFYWIAMASGDALGAMAIILLTSVFFQLYLVTFRR